MLLFFHLVNNSKQLSWKLTHPPKTRIAADSDRKELLPGICAVYSVISEYLLCISHMREAGGPVHTQKDVKNNTLAIPSVYLLLKDGKGCSTTTKKKENQLWRISLFYSQALPIPNSSSLLHLSVSGGNTVSRDFRFQLRVALLPHPPTSQPPTFAP